GHVDGEHRRRQGHATVHRGGAGRVRAIARLAAVGVDHLVDLGAAQASLVQHGGNGGGTQVVGGHIPQCAAEGADGGAGDGDGDDGVFHGLSCQVQSNLGSRFSRKAAEASLDSGSATATLVNSCSSR